MGTIELRIGNLIWDDYSGEMIISQITHSTESVNFRKTWQLPDGWALCKDIKPIPLTEKWLLRFGFEKFKNYEIYNKGDFQCEKTHPEQEEVGYWFFIEGYGVNRVYVHQLQNLYFALTGEDLICKCENSSWNRDAGCMVCDDCNKII